jgi:hypothetical protein
MKKILIALIALLSIGFIKHSEASTGFLLLKETVSFLTINKVLHHAAVSPSCGIKGCEYPGDHEAKHENQKYPRPFLWDATKEQYREATKDETAEINGNSEIDFPPLDDVEVVESEIEEIEEEIEEVEENTEADDIDDFFKDTFGDGEEEEDEEDYDQETEEEPTAEPVDYESDIDEGYDEEIESEEDDAVYEDEDDYFEEQDGGPVDTDEESNEKTTEEELEDLDISDWGIKLKEQLEEKIDREVDKVDRKIDKEIEKLRKRRNRKSTPDNN